MCLKTNFLDKQCNSSTFFCIDISISKSVSISLDEVSGNLAEVQFLEPPFLHEMEIRFGVTHNTEQINVFITNTPKTTRPIDLTPTSS